MNPHELYSLAAVARAIGLPLRRVRSWADAGSLRVVQPDRHAERLVTQDELVRLERRGLRVDWKALPADAADAANAVSDGSHDLP